MKKRSKLIATLVAGVMCLGLVVYGVYAAVTATFAMKSSFTFEALGVYVGVSGQVYIGETETDLTPLSIEGSNYKLNEVRNFTPAEGTTPDGTKSQEAIPTWRPDNVEIDELTPFIVYEVTFKNYASYPIVVTATNNTGTIDNVKITEDTGSIDSIDGGDSATYRLTLEVTRFLDDIAQKPVKLGFSMQKLIDTSGDMLSVTEDGQIEGLNTNFYTSETAPETLVIPKKVNGVAITSIKDGTASSATFKDLIAKTKNLVIKAELTEIPAYCFADSTSLTSITLPKTLTKIGNYSFKNCSSLTSIEIPDNVTDIGKCAFLNCTNLATIALSETSELKTIYYAAFANCDKLTKLFIPKKVDTLFTGDDDTTGYPANAFLGLTVCKITIAEDNENYMNDEYYSVYTKDGKTLIRYVDLGTKTDPVGGPVATLPYYLSSVENIAPGALGGYKWIRYFIIYSNVTYLGDLFNADGWKNAIGGVNCPNLQFIKIEARTSYLNTNDAYFTRDSIWAVTDSSSEPTDSVWEVWTDIPESFTIPGGQLTSDEYCHQKSAYES